MSLIASLPYDLALDIGRRVEGIRYFTEYVLRDIPCEVESINQQRKELRSLLWISSYDEIVYQMLGVCCSYHSPYNIIPANRRIEEHLWLDQDMYLCWELDEDGDWIVEPDKRCLPAHKRCW